MSQDSPVVTGEDARRLLGVSPEATDADVRAAYLEQVRQHPPDREPELFEQIRDAYEQLRNPALRTRHVLAGPDPLAPLTSVLDGKKAHRQFVGAQPWLSALKEAKEKRP